MRHDEGNLILGTKKFQEKTKRWKVTLLQKKFIHDNFVDKKKLDLKKKITLNRNCPNCKKSKNFLLFSKDFFKYKKCEKCSLVYVSPVLKENEIIKMYKILHILILGENPIYKLNISLSS